MLIGEIMLAEQMHMSRTPIRQALQVLESKGLVEIRDGAGTFVTKFTTRDIEDAYEIRRTMEVLAVRTAIYEITDEELARFKRTSRSCVNL